MTTTQTAEPYGKSLLEGDWEVVPARSEVGFATRILFGLIAVRGRFSGQDGELHIDAAGNASGVLRVETATIGTGIRKRDAHLRSKDFFHAEAHPHARFELAALTPDVDGALTLTGTLHVRDQAVPINTPVSVAQVGLHGLRIDADFEVDHRAWGFEFKRLPPTVRVQAALTLERTSAPEEG